MLLWGLVTGESGTTLGAGLLPIGPITMSLFLRRTDNACRLRRTVPNGVDIKGLFTQSRNRQRSI